MIVLSGFRRIEYFLNIRLDYLVVCMEWMTTDGERPYDFGNERQPVVRVVRPDTKRIKHCAVLVDGADFGVGEL
jgi:hypothetical protein